MKRCLFLALLATMLMSEAYARTPATESKPRLEFQEQMKTPNAISVNIGYMSLENVLTSMSEIIFAFTKPPLTKSQFITPPVGVRYMRTLNPTITLGCTANYSGYFREGALVNQDTGVEQPYKHSCNNISVAVECRFTYFRKGIVKLYGSVGLGCAYWNIVDTLNDEPTTHGVFPTVNLSPFGIRLGRKVGGFVEVGLGYRGLVSGGVDIRF